MKIDIKEIVRSVFLRAGYNLTKAKKYDLPSYIDLFGNESVENRRFYNVSAGGHFDFGCGIHHPCWTNIDVNRSWPNAIEYDPNKDIAHDLLEQIPIPVESNSAELVHSRFTIEHLTNDAAAFMFKDVLRLLKKGGIFRIVAPNIDIDCRSYFNKDKDFFSVWSPLSFEQAFLIHFAEYSSVNTPDGSFDKISDQEFKELLHSKPIEEALDYCISKYSLTFHKECRWKQKGWWAHINWWNPAKLEKYLLAAGFKTVYLSAAEQSVSPVLRNESYFDNTFNKYMFYMEAIKS